MNAWTRFFAAIGHRLWRPWLRRRLGRLAMETIDGVELVVLPEVFHPAVFRTGAFLGRVIARAPELEPASPAARLLDLGTGSGVGAVFAARRGFRVTAVDVNPRAVACARINVLVHGLEERVEARRGDLFDPVAGETFDLVAFNPPFFRGEPKDALDMAWRGADVIERFAAGLPQVLAPGGRALVVLSTDGEARVMLEALERGGFRVAAIAERRYGTEVLTAYLAQLGSADPDLVRRVGPKHPSGQHGQLVERRDGGDGVAGPFGELAEALSGELKHELPHPLGAFPEPFFSALFFDFIRPGHEHLSDLLIL